MSNNNPTGTARQMVNAPRKPKHDEQQPQPVETVAEILATDETTADQPRQPRKMLEILSSLYPPALVSFKMNIKEAGQPWNDGTVQQTVADALIPFVDPVTGHATELYIHGARIVKRTKGNNVAVDLQLPSTGTKFRTPMLDTDDERTKNALAGWRKAVADEFIAWRKRQKANGAANVTGVVQTSAIPVTGDDLTELGI